MSHVTHLTRKPISAPQLTNISCSYVSPRRRAQRTLELLEIGCREKLPWEERRQHPDSEIRTEAKVQITEDIREWDYGDYEGVTSAQIREQRQKDGKGAWDIWRDGCPGGEYVA
jgi:broad specificity phosphatase PhoE